MKLIAILITNNIATYGGASPIRQAVLFVCIPESAKKEPKARKPRLFFIVTLQNVRISLTLTARAGFL